MVLKYGKEVIWTIHFEIYEKEAQYSQSLKPRDVFVEKAVNKDEIPYAKGGARSTYAPSSFLIDLFYANPTDIRTKESFIIAKDAGGNEIGIFDNKMKGTKQKVIVPMIRILSFIDLQRCICSRPKLMQH